jgi:hypothetical protein
VLLPNAECAKHKIKVSQLNCDGQKAQLTRNF